MSLIVARSSNSSVLISSEPAMHPLQKYTQLSDLVESALVNLNTSTENIIEGKINHFQFSSYVELFIALSKSLKNIASGLNNENEKAIGFYQQAHNQLSEIEWAIDDFFEVITPGMRQYFSELDTQVASASNSEKLSSGLHKKLNILITKLERDIKKFKIIKLFLSKTNVPEFYDTTKVGSFSNLWNLFSPDRIAAGYAKFDCALKKLQHSHNNNLAQLKGLHQTLVKLRTRLKVNEITSSKAVVETASYQLIINKSPCTTIQSSDTKLRVIGTVMLTVLAGSGIAAAATVQPRRKPANPKDDEYAVVRLEDGLSALDSLTATNLVMNDKGNVLWFYSLLSNNTAFEQRDDQYEISYMLKLFNANDKQHDPLFGKFASRYLYKPQCIEQLLKKCFSPYENQETNHAHLWLYWCIENSIHLQFIAEEVIENAFSDHPLIQARAFDLEHFFTFIGKSQPRIYIASKAAELIEQGVAPDLSNARFEAMFSELSATATEMPSLFTIAKYCLESGEERYLPLAKTLFVNLITKKQPLQKSVQEYIVNKIRDFGFNHKSLLVEIESEARKIGSFRESDVLTIVTKWLSQNSQDSYTAAMFFLYHYLGVMPRSRVGENILEQFYSTVEQRGVRGSLLLIERLVQQGFSTEKTIRLLTLWVKEPEFYYLFKLQTLIKLCQRDEKFEGKVFDWSIHWKIKEQLSEHALITIWKSMRVNSYRLEQLDRVLLSWCSSEERSTRENAAELLFYLLSKEHRSESVNTAIAVLSEGNYLDKSKISQCLT